jgi:hypothetical protein
MGAAGAPSMVWPKRQLSPRKQRPFWKSWQISRPPDMGAPGMAPPGVYPARGGPSWLNLQVARKQLAGGGWWRVKCASKACSASRECAQ